MNLDNILPLITKNRIALFFLSYMIIVLLLNIVKAIILWICSKDESKNHPCEFLSRDGNEDTCHNPSYETNFRNNNNSCINCFGRSVKQSKEDIERRAKKRHRLTFIVFSLADIGRVILPYASILFTLFSNINPVP